MVYVVLVSAGISSPPAPRPLRRFRWWWGPARPRSSWHDAVKTGGRGERSKVSVPALDLALHNGHQMILSTSIRYAWQRVGRAGQVEAARTRRGSPSPSPPARRRARPGRHSTAGQGPAVRRGPPGGAMTQPRNVPVMPPHRIAVDVDRVGGSMSTHGSGPTLRKSTVTGRSTPRVDLRGQVLHGLHDVHPTPPGGPRYRCRTDD